MLTLDQSADAIVVAMGTALAKAQVAETDLVEPPGVSISASPRTLDSHG